MRAWTRFTLGRLMVVVAIVAADCALLAALAGRDGTGPAVLIFLPLIAGLHSFVVLSALGILRRVFRPTPDEGPSPMLTWIAAVVLAALVGGTALLFLAIALGPPG